MCPLIQSRGGDWNGGGCGGGYDGDGYCCDGHELKYRPFFAFLY